jgi:hypothetical protein
MPWTWARILRDHGPKSRDFICAMLTLRTWMDENGFAYPGLRTWAAGARMAVNTLRKHLDAAVRGGWLGVEVSHSKSHHNIYRCAVPPDVPLTEKDELLSLALSSQFGDIGDGVSTKSDTPAHSSDVGVSTRSDTPEEPNALPEALPSCMPLEPRAEGASEGLRVSNGASVAYQKGPDRVSTDGLRVSNGADGVSPRLTLKSSLKSLEVLEHPFSEEGAVASDSTGGGVRVKTKAKDPEAERKATEKRIQGALAKWPDYGDADIAMLARVSLGEVQAARVVKGRDLGEGPGVTKGNNLSTEQSHG